MDATITAALISGGVGALGIVGTVVTSVVGSRNTGRATEQAIAAGAANTRATLAAAREDRLWDKRAAVYEETLAAVAYRQSGLTAALRDGDVAGEELEKALQSYGSLEWAAMQGRLNAYASDAVSGASLASVVAHGTTRASGSLKCVGSGSKSTRDIFRVACCWMRRWLRPSKASTARSRRRAWRIRR